MINKFLGFKRHEKVLINDGIINDLLNSEILQLDNYDNFSSEVWKRVFRKFNALDKSKDLYNKEIVRSLYENYFINGLSEGACVGADMSRFKTKLKYKYRGYKRYKKLVNFCKYLNINDFNKYLKLNESYNIGSPWLEMCESNWINPEVLDHLYFFLTIKESLSKFENICFIGDGSGILSNIILSELTFKKVVFIDMPHFLARQFIVNYNSKKITTYFNPDNIDTELYQEKFVIINQDSFPEIPVQYLQKYFSFIKQNNKSEIYSYNKKDLSDGHCDFQNVLKDNGFYYNYSFESSIRSNYYIQRYYLS